MLKNLNISLENSDCDIINIINKDKFKYFKSVYQNYSFMTLEETKFFHDYLNNFLNEDIWEFDKDEMLNNILLELDDSSINILLNNASNDFWEKLIIFIDNKNDWNKHIELFSNYKKIRILLICILCKENDNLNINKFLNIILKKKTDVSHRIFEKFLINKETRQKIINYFISIINNSIESKNLKSIIYRDSEVDIKLNLLTDLLFKFWKKINLETLIIDEKFIYNQNCKLRWIEKKTNSDTSIKFSSQLYFIIHKLLDVSTIRYLDEIKFRKRELEMIKNEIENLEDNLPQNTSDFNYNNIYNKIKSYQLFLAKCNDCIENLNNYVYNLKYYIEDFYNFTINCFENIKPTSINTYDDVLNNLISFKKYNNFVPSLKEYKLYCRLIGENELTNNQHLKFKFVEIMFNRIDDVLAITRTNYKFIEELVLNILNLMVLIETNSGEDEMYDKVTPNFKSMYVIKKIIDLRLDFKLNINTSSYIEILCNYSKDYTDNFKKIININVNSLSQFSQSFYNNIIKIYKIENNLIDTIPEDEFEDLKELTKNYLNLLMEYLESNFMLLSTNSGLYSSLEIKNTFANTINSLLVYMLGEKKKFLNVKQKDDYNFNPKNILYLIYKLLIPLSDDLEFQTSLIYEQYNPGKLILKMNSILYNNFKINESESFVLKQFGNLLLDKFNKNKSLEEIEIPEEFCDPILDSLIEKPVYLPNSDIIMDKEVIARHLITDQHNPFNREPLTIELLEEYNKKNEIISKLNEYKEKLNKWKLDNNYG